MTRGELNQYFNEFVLTNAPKASSLKSIRSLSSLADLKMRMDKIPYEGFEKVSAMILEHQNDLMNIVPRGDMDQQNSFAHLIEICHGIKNI